MKRSWKTSLGAALTAFGAAVCAIDPNWAKVGALISAAGTCWGLLFARDHNVSSEEAGVKVIGQFIPIKK